MSNPGPANPRPLPPSDLDSKPWWDALQRQELVLQQCAACARYRWPARSVCNDCGSFDWNWIPAAGQGTVVSWTVTYHSFGPAIDVPFVVALVRLDDQDDIYIPGYIDTLADGSTMTMGMRVGTGFAQVDTSSGAPLTILRWRPLS